MKTSPCGQYTLQSQKDNRDVTLSVYRMGQSTPIQTITGPMPYTRSDWFTHLSRTWIWFSTHNQKILVDLTNNQLYTKDEDSKNSVFYWTNSHSSPDGNLLIAEGCYWAGPYQYWYMDISKLTEGGWAAVVNLVQDGIIAEHTTNGGSVVDFLPTDIPPGYTIRIAAKQTYYRHGTKLLDCYGKDNEEYNLIKDKCNDNRIDMVYHIMICKPQDGHMVLLSESFPTPV
jgi:hypothetical protein